MTRVLSLPGYLGSGPEHWQTHWERLDTRIQRVEQARWDAPECAAWCAALESAVMADLRPTVLVGHSLGAVTVVQWAGRTRASHVAGALLVAPADVEHLPPELGDFSSFSPLPRERLPFPSLLVGSQNDPFLRLSRAEELAEAWGARFVDAGSAGHINAESDLGTWSFGRSLLRELAARAAFALDTRLAGDCFVVGESALSLLLLMNDARYPWFILVPKRSAVSEFFDLDDTDQRALARESQVLTQALAETFDADKMNTGALGNVVRQLHLHHVVRRLGDPAWPGPVWGHSPRQPYGSGTERNLIAKIFAHPAVAAHFDPVL
jgi:predicted alpha/beta hydrolase family esterase/diadenosine tetraphosphate (Ap4A) HIT family hydrolase